MTLSRTIIITFLLSIVPAFAAEQLRTPVPIIGSFFSLTLVYNPGVAFSLHFPSWLQTTLIIAALIGVIIAACRSARSRAQSLAYGMTIGGALANVVDRIIDGFVTDYLSVGSFPVFNIADAFICIGIGLLLLEGEGRKTRE